MYLGFLAVCAAAIVWAAVKYILWLKHDLDNRR